jgi:thioesterase domain-containing protein
MNPLISHLERRLNEDIPLTGAMGLTVAGYTGRSLSLRAPLEKNYNHKATAFGGSLYSVAVLAGWGFLFLKLQESGRGGRIVIQESRIRYLRPVAEDIVATCRLASDGQLERFLHTFDRRGTARIDLNCAVEAGGAPAVEFEGRYVVQA